MIAEQSGRREKDALENPADAPAVIALFEAYVLLGIDPDTAGEKVLNVMRGKP